ncbi:MAG: mechanosensitive ion channel family protein, partial [Cyanobacteria bacterium]|nr:mechanosensitive ion channel family protein [Cyanobacteriota bacterium]
AALLGIGIAMWMSLSATPAAAQFGLPLQDMLSPLLHPQTNTGEVVRTVCVRLDGHCVFRIAATPSDLYPRVATIEAQLVAVRNEYLTAQSPNLVVSIQNPSEEESPPEPPDNATLSPTPPRKSPEIYVAVGDRPPTRLMSVTRFEADPKGVDVQTTAELLTGQIEEGLRRSYRERQSSYLLAQTGLAIGTLLVLLGAIWGLRRWESRLQRGKRVLREALKAQTQTLSALLDERRRWNMTEAQLRLSQLVQAGVWVAGGLLIFSRFPYTRIITVQTISGLRIPLRLLVVALGIYVAVRLSFALINRLTALLVNNYEINPEVNRRTQLRVQTISRVSRGIVTLVFLGVGFMAALTAIGVNIAPLLAGAGLIGVALSLPAQSLIKDAINGFLIILEDQYAVGDVITVHGIRGLVENINLRITQIRDEEGRLVTIPNSEIGVIANHSSHWSQADVYIPISYHADVDKVLELIEITGQAMQRSDRWHGAMLAEPEVLGIEDFGERGLTVRVWIKTQPLKQWDVAREYRRRLKVALDGAGIEIPAHIDFKAPH